MWDTFCALRICVACLLPELIWRSVGERTMWTFNRVLALQQRLHSLIVRISAHPLHNS